LCDRKYTNLFEYYIMRYTCTTSQTHIQYLIPTMQQTQYRPKKAMILIGFILSLQPLSRGKN